MCNRGKTILILGNGFDLAHNLPTRYADFLVFCEKVETLFRQWKNNTLEEDFKNTKLKEWRTDESIILTIRNALDNTKDNDEIKKDRKILLEIFEQLNNNIWYDYFCTLYNEKRMRGENWIDFETEISLVIECIDKNTFSLNGFLNEILKITNDYFKKSVNRILEKDSIAKITIRKFREILFYDLEKLTRALELYLSHFVEKINITEKVKEISDLNPDYVITFNYTNTYERVYGRGEVFHIHGTADEERAVQNNNMVLGIDEYWNEDERDKKINFAIFKKFVQRIRKHTGNENYRYIKEIEEIYHAAGSCWSGIVDRTKQYADGVTQLYIFGHSLDITDKDVLSKFIETEATAVTIYCHDRGTEGELITNTIGLIGEERLIEKAKQIPEKLKYIITE